MDPLALLSTAVCRVIQNLNCVEGSSVGRIPSRIITRPDPVDLCSSAESAHSVPCIPSTSSVGPRRQLVPRTQPRADPPSPRPCVDTAVIQFDNMADAVLQNSILKKREKGKSSLHKCMFCDYDYKSSKAYYNHMRNVHDR